MKWEDKDGALKPGGSEKQAEERLFGSDDKKRRKMRKEGGAHQG